MAVAVATDPGLFEAWLEAEPEWRLARVFLCQAREPRFEVWSAFEHALRETVWRVRDARVAQAKLGWWLDEIGQARAGAAHHPVLQRMAALGALDLFDRGGAEGILRGASHAAAMESPADVESMLAAFVALEQPLAQARARLAGVAVADGVVVRGLAAARVLCECRHWARFALPERARLPLDLLARHGVGRDAAVAQEPLLAAALAQGLLPHIDAALAGGSPSVLDTATLLIGRSLAAPNSRVANWRLAFALWRLARRAARA